MSSWYQANRRKNWGLVWRNRKKISQIIKDYFHLPFFLLIILWSGWVGMMWGTMYEYILVLWAGKQFFVFRDRKYCNFTIPGSSLDTMEMRTLLTGQEVRFFLIILGVCGKNYQLQLLNREKKIVFAVQKILRKYWRQFRNSLYNCIKCRTCHQHD
jgi:hypothetical protein